MCTMRADERQLLAAANEELERGIVGRQNPMGLLSFSVFGGSRQLSKLGRCWRTVWSRNNQVQRADLVVRRCLPRGHRSMQSLPPFGSRGS